MEGPFGEEVARFRLPMGFKVPATLDFYDGKGDPEEHLEVFKTTLMRFTNCSVTSDCFFIVLAPLSDSSRGIERILTGKFASIKGKRIVELPMIKPIDASRETIRLIDKISVISIPIKRNLPYVTQFTYAVPIAAAKVSHQINLLFIVIFTNDRR